MRSIASFLVLLALVVPTACQPYGPPRPLDLPDRAIAYSGYRDGQAPDGDLPTQEQVAEDLRLLAKNWRLIRVYSADRHGEDVLEVIRRETLDLKVMLGIWLAREPGAEQENVRQAVEGIRLANEYEDIVVAVNVGNEALIEWTEHPVPERRVLNYVRRVRARVPQPVTVADNYVWWRDHGAALVREVDFITIHTYPLWEQRDIDEGLAYTIENYEDVRAAYPDKPIVIGEAGWATYTEGNLHVPRGGDELKQQRYYEKLTGWAMENGITVFFFEAFDEPWKGTGTEGHWGLFTVDRRAKPVMRELYPELATDQPTSPTYPERITATGPDIGVAFRTSFAALLPDASANPLGPGLASSRVVESARAEGGSVLQLELNGESWAGVYFMLGSYDASAASTLAMSLRLPRQVTQLELKLEGPANHSQSVELMDYAAERDDSGWTRFSVPLTEFDRVDLSRVTILGLWNPSNRRADFIAAELLVDDIRFE